LGTASGIGIGIGIGIVVTLAFVFLVGINQGTPTLVNIPTLDFDNVQFARVDADYDETDNRLAVFLYFTDNDGNNVKADGTGTITVTRLDSNMVKKDLSSSYDVEFKKDRFLTWRDNSGFKHTAYRFDINEFFGGKGTLWWDVSMDITLEDGRTWVDVDNRFYSLD